METPDLFARPYLTLVTAAELPNPPQGPIKAAVYAPGLICGAADDHRDAAATLTYGFLLPDAVRQSFFGSTCVTHWAPEAQPQPWQAALEQRHYVAGTEVPVNWRATTRRDYWRVVPLVSLIVSVEPRQKTRAMLRGYLKQMTTAHQRLTKAQSRTLWAIIQERGAQEPARRSDLVAHRQVLKERRDRAFRLHRLWMMPMGDEDYERIESLQAYHLSWRDGHMRQLTARQVRLIRTLEAKCQHHRLRAMETWAQELIDSHGW